MGVLGNLPQQRVAIGLWHPVVGLDELVRGHPGLERSQQLRRLDRYHGFRLLQFGRVHDATPSKPAPGFIL
jgi:hypothetical protein